MSEDQIVEGFLRSIVPGRTDRLHVAVRNGAYVLPADHVAALGEDNSLAGADRLNKLFGLGPYGRLLERFAAGGRVCPNLLMAGGEFIVPPDKIIEKFGNLETGRDALDRWVVHTRRQHVRTLRRLPPPRRDGAPARRFLYLAKAREGR